MRLVCGGGGGGRFTKGVFGSLYAKSRLIRAERGIAESARAEQGCVFGTTVWVKPCQSGMLFGGVV